MLRIRIQPHNGLSIPGIGHLVHGEHDVDVSRDDLKDAEGIEILSPKIFHPVRTENIPTQPKNIPTRTGGKYSAPTNQKENKPTDVAQLKADILDAMQQLDTSDVTMWMKDGRPKTEALETFLAYKITAVERDEAVADTV